MSPQHRANLDLSRRAGFGNGQTAAEVSARRIRLPLRLRLPGGLLPTCCGTGRDRHPVD